MSDDDYDLFLSAVKYLLSLKLPGRKNTQINLAKGIGRDKVSLNAALNRRIDSTTKQEVRFSDEAVTKIAGYYGLTVDGIIQIGEKHKSGEKLNYQLHQLKDGKVVAVDGDAPRMPTGNRWIVVGRPLNNPYPQDKKLTAFIPEQVHRCLKMEAASRDVPMVRIVVEALINELLEGDYEQRYQELQYLKIGD